MPFTHLSSGPGRLSGSPDFGLSHDGKPGCFFQKGLGSGAQLGEGGRGVSVASRRPHTHSHPSFSGAFRPGLRNRAGKPARLALGWGGGGREAGASCLSHTLFRPGPWGARRTRGSAAWTPAPAQHSPAPAQAQVPILCCCHREPRRTAACRCHGVGMKLQPLHNCNRLFSPHTFLKYFF